MPEYRNIPYNYSECYSEIAQPGMNTLCVTVPELVECGVSDGYLWRVLSGQRNGEIYCWPHHKEGRIIYLHYNGLGEKYKKLISVILCNNTDVHSFVKKRNAIKKDNELRNICSGLPSMIEIRKDEEAFLLETGYLKATQIHQILRASGWCRLWRQMNVMTARKIGFKSVTDVQKAIYDLCMEEQKNGFVKFPKPIGSIRVLDRKAREYADKGITVLVSGKFGNTDHAKVNTDVENILLYLFADDTKPNYTCVHGQFQAFVNGYFDIVNKETGELFDAAKFVQPFGENKGEPLTLSLSTVRSWIQKPENYEAMMKIRQGRLENINRRPHVKRHAPHYSLSKITMDDISIPFKMENGKRPWGYQAFDVASTACIGYAFAREDKGGILFETCMRNLFMGIVQNNWGMPGQVEIERHLTTHYKGKENEEGEFVSDILTPGQLFPFVHFCLGANPREKRAEGFIKQKKYHFQSRRDGFQRRPFAKNESNRMNEDKDMVRYSYNEIVRNETEDINSYNNALHPDQTLYPGMSRREVFVSNMNPKLEPANLPVIARHVGYSDDSRINNSQFVMANNRQYILPSVDDADKLRKHRDQVKVYWVNDQEVYLYYKDKYLCTCKEWTSYNEALCEQTQEDKAIFQEQMKYLSHYDKKVKEKVTLIKSFTSVGDERENRKILQAARKKEAKKEKKEAEQAEVAGREDFFEKKGIVFSDFK